MSLMSNVLAFPAQPVLPSLSRPAALVRAAIAGQALARLRADEDRMNAARQEGAADYDLHQHVMLMIAILAESRLAMAQATGPRLRAIG